MPTTVEIPGVGEVEFPDSMSQAEINAQAKRLYEEASSGEPASMTKTAVPTTETYAPGFLETLAREVKGGYEDIRSGAGEIFSLPDRGTINPMTGALRAGMGGLRIATSPVTALGSEVGERVGEGVRSTLYPYVGELPSSVAGTVAGTTTNLGTQLIAAPYALAKMAPYATKATQKIARSLPGAQVTLREMAKKVVDSWPSALRPAKSSQTLFAELSQMKPKIKLPEFKREAQAILKREKGLEEFGLAGKEAESVAGKITKAVAEPVELNSKWLGDEFNQIASTQLKDIPFSRVQEVRKRIGERIKSLRNSDAPTSREQLGAMKQLFKALSDDLERSTAQNAGPAYAKLKEANAAANREFALDELDDVFFATMGKAREGAQFTSSNFAQALNKIRQMRRDEPLFEKGIGSANLNRIEKRLDEFRQLKILPPPKNVNVGSALVNTRVAAGTGIGFAVGNMIGGPGAGMTVGALSGVTGAIGPPIISRIMQSERGSKALMNLLKSEGTVSPQHIGAIFALIQGEEAIRNNLADRVRSALKSDDVPLEDKISAALRKDSVFREATEAEAILR